ncbi:putative G-protein coupled receptor 83 [Taenia solium]|eukprot:TsM_000642900 transcript=TsM_000642900 gene=TsM_000642900
MGAEVLQLGVFRAHCPLATDGDQPVTRFTSDARFLLIKLFALSSTCANPFLYGWLNENIRKSIIRRTGQCMKKSSHYNQASMNANCSQAGKATEKPHSLVTH